MIKDLFFDINFKFSYKKRKTMKKMYKLYIDWSYDMT